MDRVEGIPHGGLAQRRPVRRRLEPVPDVIEADVVGELGRATHVDAPQRPAAAVEQRHPIRRAAVEIQRVEGRKVQFSQRLVQGRGWSLQKFNDWLLSFGTIPQSWIEKYGLD